MAKLIFEHIDEAVTLKDGAPIMDSCEEAGIPFACTEGCCGTCVIQVIEGMENLSKFNEIEEDFFGDMDDERLACQCKIKGKTVKITV